MRPFAENFAREREHEPTAVHRAQLCDPHAAAEHEADKPHATKRGARRALPSHTTTDEGFKEHSEKAAPGGRSRTQPEGT